MSLSDKRLLVLFSVCLNIGFLGIAGFAFVKHQIPGHGPGREKRGYMQMAILEEMPLPPEKRAALGRAMDEHMRKLWEIRSRSKERKLSVLGMLAEASPPEDAVIIAHLRDITAIEVEQERAKIMHLQAVRRTLTDEEAREFFERLAEAYRRRSAHYRGGPGK